VHRYKDDACLPLFIVGIILTAGFFLLHRWAMYVVESSLSSVVYKSYIAKSGPSQVEIAHKPVEVDLNDIETTASIGMKLDPEEKELAKFSNNHNSNSSPTEPHESTVAISRLSEVIQL
jgi:hypothetical protein